MNADIISVGQNTLESKAKAAAYISKALSERGITDVSSTPAEHDSLAAAIRAALSRSNIIVILGGVGTDVHDNTVSTLADVISAETELNPNALNRVAEYYAKTGSEMPASATNAASVISGSTVLMNPSGAAAGCAVRSGSQYIMVLPDSEEEIAAMLDGDAGNYLNSVAGAPVGTETADSEEHSDDNGGTHLTFNPGAIMPDEKTPDQSSAQEPYVPAEQEPFILPDDKSDVDLAKTIVIGSESEASEELGADADENGQDDAAYVVLTSEKGKDKNKADAQDKPKESVGMRILKYLVPWKGDAFVDILRKIVFAVAVVGLIVSSCYIGDFFIKMADNNKVVNDARDIYDPDDNSVDQNTGVYNRFNELIAQNSDCVGWITVPNTKIDNPVYQTTDNDFYLHNNSLKEKSVYGAIFADYRDLITRAGNTKNVTLYGHHMKDGTMFAQLHKYKSLSFYKENPVITFDTIYGTGGQYKVIGCFITNSNPMDDNGYFFDFAAPSFRSDADFINWIEQIRRRSLYITPVDVNASDEILTMSTCTYEIKESNLLCVVVARKVRDGESVTVNTIDTYANDKIIYPAVWYEKFGGQKPTYADGVYTWVSGDYDRENINAPTDTSSLDTVSMNSEGETLSVNVSSDVTSEPPAPSSTPEDNTSSTSAEPDPDPSGGSGESAAPSEPEPEPSSEPTSSEPASSEAESAASDTPDESSQPAESLAGQSD